MNNNNNNENNQKNIQSQPLSQKELEKKQNHEASQDVAHTVGKGAATYFGGAVGNKLYDVASKTKLGQGIEKGVGKALESSPVAKPAMNALHKSGATKLANNAIDTLGGKKNSNMLKGAGTKTTIASPKNTNINGINSINRGHNLVEPPLNSDASSEQINNQNIALEKEKNEILLRQQQQEQEQEELLQQEQEEKEKEKKKKQTAKAILKVLIQNPAGMLVVGGSVLLVILIFWFIYISISDYDLVGTEMNNYSQAEMISGYCNQIILIKEHDDFTGKAVSNIDDVDLEETFVLNKKNVKRWSKREFDVETYVKGVVQAEAIDVQNEKTFEVAAIAARTYALQITSKRCFTWDNTNKRPQYRNPQNFTDSTVDGDVASAVMQTNGLVVTLENKLLKMSGGNYYDYFCHIGKDVDKDEHVFYKMLQENEEERLFLPIDWVNKNVPSGDFNRSGKYDGDCQQDGMSLFGAKYLLNKKADAYTTIRIIKYYYGYHTVLKRLSYASVSNGCFYWPTTSTRITSNFGLRDAPTAGASTNHGAIDIGVPEGSNVFATSSGTVKFAGAASGYGYAVYIDHGNGLVSRYGHLLAGGIKVSTGQTVTAGQVIALSGNTGVSTGPHLHFEMRLNDVKVNPLNYVSPSNPTPTNCGTLNTGGIVNTGENAKSICLTLKNSGFTNAQIGAIMANLYSESGFSPLAVNSSSGAYGIAQWLGGRKTALLSMANYQSLEVQLAFLLNELNTSEASAYQHLLSSGNDANVLTGVFCNKFERPGQNTCTSRQAKGHGVTYANYATNNCS